MGATLYREPELISERIHYCAYKSCIRGMLISKSMNRSTRPRLGSFKLNRVLSPTMIHFWCEFGRNGFICSRFFFKYKCTSTAWVYVNPLTSHVRYTRVHLSVKVHKNYWTGELLSVKVQHTLKVKVIHIR